MDAAVKAARAAGADVIVSPFPDPIGKDAVIQWPGGLNMQLFWHISKPSYAPLQSIPENRVYVSADRADNLVRSFVRFSHGRVVSDDQSAPGVEIGLRGSAHRRIRIESAFGKMTVFVTNGHLPYPYGRELTGYEVQNLSATLVKATSSSVVLLVGPYQTEDRTSAILEFPGGYIAEVHQNLPAATKTRRL